MTIAFNADEVLAMAERIERNGIRFYTAAARGIKKYQVLFARLAQEEARHEAIFAAMRQKLPLKERETTSYDPGGQNGLYLQAMADRAVFKKGVYPGLKKGPAEAGLAEVIDTAIGNEKDSIVFYVGLRELVPANLGRNRISAIIAEEYGHIAFLRGITLKK